MMFRALLLYTILIQTIQAKSLYADFAIEKGPYKQEDVARFMNKLNILNRLQAEILEVPLPANDENDDPMSYLTITEHEKPDQLPYLFEGDMVLTDEQMDNIIRNVRDQYWARKSRTNNDFLYAIRSRRSMTSSLSQRWTFPIPFYINTGTGVNSNAILAGVQKWQEETCVRFTQSNSLPRVGNAIEFILGSGCWSYIGKIGSSSQQISIGNGCTSLGTVTHEIGHALGFYHEQARYDRDEYVSILTQNIQSSYLSQFSKQSFSSMVDYGVGYDYGSVMHYDQLAFSSTGGNTIATTDPNYQATIGQRIAPSFADVKRINFAYCNCHALGFYHEQARYDRDEYVSILTQNIQSSYLSQFSKQSFSSMVDYGVGYDYGSVMHYDQLAFSSTGGNTIATTDPNYQATIGQRIAPSFADVKRINFAYCNSTCSTVLLCQNGGYTNPNNCSSCKCPPGFGGTLCDVAGDSSPGCGSGNLNATNSVQTISARGALSCNYLITAPLGTKVYFQMTGATFARSSPCSSNYLEINYRSDFTRVGARFCTSYPTISLSETNIIVVIYKGVSGSAFSMNYRYDPVQFSTTTTTTPTPTTTSTTTVATTLLTTLMTTRSTTTTRVTYTIPTTVATTTSPLLSTSTVSSQCSQWSSCSANCGGCGTQSRRCNNYVETVYCNTNPCSGGYCCRPFFYVTQFSQGYCRRPSSDEGKQLTRSG